ncbi:DNA-binding transcriptional LysR family regulator [Rhizobium leguminosarum]|uniref:DNA-binding transcriptional LysR family regulator n=1 Tax=Rhizobium esperanzae TaxID=1967781 RepID=A0A7W6UHI1_9HYPH|nr:DNA-binding transcriptional LysR family regulator [Rhizobium esperanzae]MDH6201045.1 DNA-binding transcriptional LysR family regulator [Rhizobium leguminosarum]
MSLVSAGLGIGFAPEWTEGLRNRAFELKAVRGIDFRIGLGVAWNKEDPTASCDDIVDSVRSLARPAGQANVAACSRDVSDMMPARGVCHVRLRLNLPL